MKLVGVQVDGETKFYPPAPNWDQLWGSGPYWGPTRDAPREAAKPVTQEAIGTSPATPVVVKVQGGTIGMLLPFLTIFVTVVAAFGGAYFAQRMNHRLAEQRDRDKEERDRNHLLRVDEIAAIDEALVALHAHLEQLVELVFTSDTARFNDIRVAKSGELVQFIRWWLRNITRVSDMQIRQDVADLATSIFEFANQESEQVNEGKLELPLDDLLDDYRTISSTYADLSARLAALRRDAGLSPGDLAPPPALIA